MSNSKVQAESNSIDMTKGSLQDYVQIARPDHWFKNIFMVPGMVFAYMYFHPEIDLYIIGKLLLAVISTCLIASANYVINEWLDAEFDKFHPTKKFRTSVTKVLKAKLIYSEYVILALVGLSIAYYLSLLFFSTALLLLVMGFFYNVNPFRTKERAYLDVLSESVNNPIRFILGWLVFAPTVLPPSSILVAYWMGGAFLMACKRYSEYRFIDNPEQAALYRKSFKTYSENSLLISIFFYALTATFFLGIFLIKYRIELLLTFPFFALMFSWYLRIALRADSTAQRPEKLYTNKYFMVFLILFGIFISALLFIDIPWLHYFLKNNFG